MFLRTLSDLEKSGRIKYPADASFRSARFITAQDNLGFSFNENHVSQAITIDVWLKNHWEANYIRSGTIQVTDLHSNKTWHLTPGSVYVVGPNDRHRLHLSPQECHISVFHPPLTGDERFDEDGSYELSGAIDPTDRRMFVKDAGSLRRLDTDGVTQTARLLTAEDAIGFHLVETRLQAGFELSIGPDTRPSARHILSGSGCVTDSQRQTQWQLTPSMTIVTEPFDQLSIRANSDIVFLTMSSN